MWDWIVWLSGADSVGFRAPHFIIMEYDESTLEWLKTWIMEFRLNWEAQMRNNHVLALG